MEFITAIIQHGFLQNALVAGLLASVTCGIIGPFVLLKRITFIAGGIAHAVFGGVGLAYFLGYDPFLGAVAAAILSAVIIGFTALKAQENEDTMIGALWAIGMATGVICISLTPGYAVDLLTFLFGNILLVSQSDLVWLFGIFILIVLAVFFFYRQFVAIAFDEEYARLRKIPTKTLYILLLALVALTVVVLLRVVGIVLVIALITLPSAIANLFSKKLPQMILLASLLGFLFVNLGIYLSFSSNLPAGATIIVVAGISYILTIGFKKIFN